MSFFAALVPKAAHIAGAVDLVFSPPTKAAPNGQLITGGADSLLRVFPIDPSKNRLTDKDPKTIEKHMDSITAIVAQSDCVITASDDHKVAVFDLPSFELRKYLVRGTSPVKHISLSPDGARLAVVTDESTIKVVNVDEAGVFTLLRGHAKQVKSVAWDPKGEYLASADIEGSVFIWEEKKDGSFACVKQFKELMYARSSGSPELGRMSWHPSGKHLAVPGKKTEIVVIDRDTWKISTRYQDGDHMNVSMITFSPNGLYFAALTIDDRIIVWKTGEKDASIINHRHSAKVSTMVWHPKDNAIAFSDMSGKVYYAPGIIPVDSGYPHPAKGASVLSVSNQHTQQQQQQLKAKNDPLADMFDDDDNASTITKATVATLKKSGKGGNKDGKVDVLDDFLDEDAREDDDMMDDYDADGLGDFVVDDDGAGYAEGGIDAAFRKRRSIIPRGFDSDDLDMGGHGHGGDDGEDVGAGGAVSRRRHHHMESVSEIQPAFQPGSTPSKANRRYLAFNMTGVVFTVEHTDHCQVTIEFHDRSIMKPIHFTDHYKYSMSALGERGAVFASQASDEHPSTVFYRPFDTWANKSEWLSQLPENENAKSLALTTNGIVLATDQKYLRFFSYGGVQTYLLCLAGPVVSMASYQDTLMVVYHLGGAYHGEQNLGYLLFDVVKKVVLRKDALPISPSARLDWIGFSDSGIPCSYDSSGVLRGCLLYQDYAWVPLLDARLIKNPTGGSGLVHYWPIGLTDTQFICLILRGGEKHPPIPRPLMSEVDLSLPLLDLSSVNGALEEKYLRTRLVCSHVKGVAKSAGGNGEELEFLRKDAEMDKMILQLIQNGCKSDKLQRTLDLTTLLNIPKSVDGAMKIAMAYHQPQLAERMAIIREAKIQEQEQEDDEVDNPRSFKKSGIDFKTELETLRRQYKEERSKEIERERVKLRMLEQREVERQREFGVELEKVRELQKRLSVSVGVSERKPFWSVGGGGSDELEGDQTEGMELEMDDGARESEVGDDVSETAVVVKKDKKETKPRNPFSARSSSTSLPPKRPEPTTSASGKPFNPFSSKNKSSSSSLTSPTSSNAVSASAPKNIFEAVNHVMKIEESKKRSTTMIEDENAGDGKPKKRKQAENKKVEKKSGNVASLLGLKKVDSEVSSRPETPGGVEDAENEVVDTNVNVNVKEEKPKLSAADKLAAFKFGDKGGGYAVVANVGDEIVENL